MRLYSTPLHRVRLPPNAAFPNGLTVIRPVLHVTVLHSGRSVTCHAIVDSGSDHCNFPMSVADLLKLDRERMPRVAAGGLGSFGVPTFFENIEVDLQGLVRYQLYAGFSEGLNHWGVALLGQHGFFDRFDVIFRAREGVFDIAI